jgi:tripartite-type tricarboxylate transporter receptor subunit TctC
MHSYRAWLAVLSAAVLPATVLAQSWPSQNIRAVIGYAPGGPLDIVTRIVAQDMSESLGKPVVVDNRPGASGWIATQQVAQAAPDGHTIMFVPSTYVVNPLLMEQVKYDPVTAFAPVANLATLATVVVTNPSTKVNSLKELMALAKATPGSVTYGSSGSGGPAHLASEMLQAQTGVQMVHVPFEGTAPALAEVMAGRVTFMFNGVPGLRDHAAAGRLKLLAISGIARRHPQLPEVPTMAEAGFPGFEDVGIWFGVVAPKGTPAPVVARLNEAITRAIARPEVIERLTPVGAVPTGGTPAEFAEFLRRDVERWTRIIRSARITASPG